MDHREDDQQMMEQLGIRALRPGPSGNEQDANHANCDKAKANPFPALPALGENTAAATPMRRIGRIPFLG
jgi:hypothetical protein